MGNSRLSLPITSKHLEKYGTKTLKIGCASMHGSRATNEDDHCVKIDFSPKRHPNTTFVGVFDGHSGSRTSSFCRNEIHKAVSTLSDLSDSKELEGAVLAVDKKLLEETDRNPTNPNRDDAGSTLVFATIQPIESGQDGQKKHSVTVSHCGDSRALIISSNGDIRALTTDHKPTLASEADRIYAADGAVVRGRIDDLLAVSRAVGDFQFKRNPTRGVTEQKVIAVPSCCSVQLLESDLVRFFFLGYSLFIVIAWM